MLPDTILSCLKKVLLVWQAQCAELEEQEGRLESQIRVTEQRCAATQNSVDVLQQVNVQLRQQMDASHAITSQQVAKSWPVPDVNYAQTFT